jgi:hypothetical protein
MSIKTLEPLSERCFECGEAIPPGEEHIDCDGHCYHPECCPDCSEDWEDEEDDQDFECLK